MRTETIKLMSTHHRSVTTAVCPVGKYRPFPGVTLFERTWPANTVTKAPRWCSVDLRDGNQALAVPMTVEQKIAMFQLLVGCGFKEIEVGFPFASPTEFGFIRQLIDEGLIPDDVTIQVLTQAREEQIIRTVESLVGAKKVIIHLYNSTSPAQRRIVFGKSKAEIMQIAVQGTQWVKKYAADLAARGTKVTFQYSPESFSATEVEFAVEICEAVADVWEPTPKNKMILNLPNTVEVAGPNVYADQIEYFCRHFGRRDSVIISLHTHNDRGTGVASTELGLLAGGDRVEGTLFGNGERTGNLDIVTVALNLFTQGINPGLNFFNLGDIREGYESCTGMTVPARQPYSGELVFTAFSGSHQDAIKKGLAEWARGEQKNWDVPYLVIDPADVNRHYRETIRVNGQSGKAGVTWLLEQSGIFLPRGLQLEFGPIAGKLIDAIGKEVTAVEVRDMFCNEYVGSEGDELILRDFPYVLESFDVYPVSQGQMFRCRSVIRRRGEQISLSGEGNGPIAAFVAALKASAGEEIEVLDYHEHAMETGAPAPAIAYVHIRFSDGETRWGVGIDTNSARASIRAIVSALSRRHS